MKLPSTSGRGAGGEGKTTSFNEIGSSKSFSIVFIAQKVLRKVTGWTFAVTTDHVELDEQIAKTFKACGAVSEAEADTCRAASSAHTCGSAMSSLIRKFQPERIRAETSSPNPVGPASLSGRRAE